MNKTLQRLFDTKTKEIRIVIKERGEIESQIQKLEAKYKKLGDELGKLRDERTAISTVMKMEEQCEPKP